MPTAINASRAALLKNSLRQSLYLTAAMACLWPVLAQAQTWNPTASDANSNTAAGTSTLTNHTSGGTDNTGIGYAALTTNTAGFNNTASGSGALRNNTTGSNNTASGFRALENNTTGGGNAASGVIALGSNTTGNNNTACGTSALISNTTGSNNVAVGATSLFHLFSNTTASNNVAVGYFALNAVTSGNSNIALGANAGKNLTSGSRNIYIGNGGATHENNVIRIGQVQTKTFIAGIAGVAASGATVVVKSNGQLGVVASSARYKTDIRDLSDASDRLGQLRPVSYQYKTEPGVTHFGLIAEEVDKVMPELVVRDEQNRPETVQYQELIPLLLQQVKAQRVQIQRLTAKIDELSRARLAAK